MGTDYRRVLAVCVACLMLSSQVGFQSPPVLMMGYVSYLGLSHLAFGLARAD